MIDEEKKTVEKIKKAALEEFYEKGYGKASLRTIYRSRMNEEPDKELIRILARTRLDGCLEILKGNYDMEYSLYLTKELGVYATGGTEKLIKELNEFHG